MKRLLIIHPFLFAIYPILAVLAGSISILSPIQVIRPTVVILASCATILLLLYRLYRDWPRAGFVTSIIVIMLLYYGYSYRLPREITILSIPVSRHLLILLFWAAFLSVISSHWLWTRVRPPVITNFLNISSALALIRL